MRLFLVVVTLAMLTCCSSGPDYVVRTLSSGKLVKVISTEKIFFSKDKPALILKYQTDIPLSDKPALEKEIDEIWLRFQDEVDKADSSTGIISANEKPAGFPIKISKSENFVYQKSPAGQWSRTVHSPM